jgi:hypothetical protein
VVHATGASHMLYQPDARCLKVLHAYDPYLAIECQGSASQHVVWAEWMTDIHPIGVMVGRGWK